MFAPDTGIVGETTEDGVCEVAGCVRELEGLVGAVGRIWPDWGETTPGVTPVEGPCPV